MNALQVQGTIQWNIDRGNTKGDLDTELRIFSEEVREFWEAKTLVDRVDAYCDSQFVAVGTNFKLGNHPIMDDFMVNSIDAMLSYMMLHDFKPVSEAEEDLVFSLLTTCYHEVLIANNLKPKEKVNGKIIKGDKWYDPKTKIQEHLDAYFPKG